MLRFLSSKYDFEIGAHGRVNFIILCVFVRERTSHLLVYQKRDHSLWFWKAALLRFKKLTRRSASAHAGEETADYTRKEGRKEGRAPRPYNKAKKKNVRNITELRAHRPGA